jgi:hypothetical protein
MSPQWERKPNVSQTGLALRIRTRGARIQHASMYLCALALGAVLAACSEQQSAPFAPVTLASNTPTDPAAPATLGWNEQARMLVASNNLGPPAAGRIYAALAAAQYAALTKRVADVDAEADLRIAGTDTDFEGADEPRDRPPAWQRGAVAGASWLVLGFFFPSAEPALAQRVIDEGQDNPRFARGLEVGKRMGNRMIERAQSDHFTDVWTGTVPVGPGLWTNNGPPVAPMLGNMTPYFLTSGDQFRPPPPPEFGSAEFLADLQEVRTISDTRTPRQLEIASFWNFGTGTPTPLGVWNQIASDHIRENGLGEQAAAHVLALMHTAMMDAFIGCWNAKYYYWVLRPSQADPAITTPLGLPNHPAYSSGHSCGSAAATTVLAKFFPHQQEELRRQMIQAGNSRIYGGIHYRFDVTAGQDLGKLVARRAIRIDERSGLLSVLQ